MKIKIACGTNNKKDFTSNHFGDSEYFLIYEYNSENQSIELIKEIKNTFEEEEEEHGDVEKAKGVSAILKDVQVLAAFVMGPNVTRMRKKFVPVISREKNILKTLDKIKEKMSQIKKESQLLSGKDREIFIID